MYYIYILGCSDGSLYTGVTSDIRRRVREHYYRLPSCAKYTASHPVRSLNALWTCSEKSDAYRLEYYIKRLSRKNKLTLIESPGHLEYFFSTLNCCKYSPCADITLSQCLSPEGEND
jgi:putative endonuclease